MPKTVLVVPGTGKQGRVVTRELLLQGHTVRILVRNPDSDPAKEARAAGAHVFVGNLDSPDALSDAFHAVDAVFLAIPADPNNEIPYASNVLKVAREEGVQHFVYSSVARAGDHESFPGWNDDYPLAWYWKGKHEIEEMVRKAGFPTWTILRPAFFFDNFYRPEVEWMFPGLADKHELRVAYNPDTKLDMIHASDIAAVTAAVIGSPSKFAGKDLTLGSESLTLAQIAEQLSTTIGDTVTVTYLDDEEIKKQIQQGNLITESQLWHRDVGYGVGSNTITELGLQSVPISEALKKENLKW